jgi:hypothetical protein
MPAEQGENGGITITADPGIARAKYESRRKPFPPKPLPAAELVAAQENEPLQRPSENPSADPDAMEDDAGGGASRPEAKVSSKASSGFW